MAQQNYGAAEPIADFFGFGKKKSKKSPNKPTDASWHDAMVKQANESFAKKKVGSGQKNHSTRKSAPRTKRSSKRLKTKG